ncbi:MAG: nitroreductase family protein [Dehalococcoidia bacterium]
MRSAWEAIKARRSIRKFSPDDVPEEMINQMLEAARLAPSGGNVQPWRFLVVRSPELKQKLREICMEQRFIEEVPVVIVCFGDLTRYSPEAATRRRQDFMDSGVLETLSGRFADPEFRARMQSMPTPSREQLLPGIVANTYIAIEHLVIMATALGLGTCWVGGFDRAAINRLFALADTLVPVAVIPVGYPAGKLPPPRPRLSIEEILVEPQVQPTDESV